MKDAIVLSKEINDLYMQEQEVRRKREALEEEYRAMVDAPYINNCIGKYFEAPDSVFCYIEKPVKLFDCNVDCEGLSFYWNEYNFSFENVFNIEYDSLTEITKEEFVAAFNKYKERMEKELEKYTK